MYEYVFTDSEKTLDTTGFCENLSDVKKEILSQTPDCIHYRSTYPNGFIFESLQYADKLIIRTNRELHDNGDGLLIVLDK